MVIFESLKSITNADVPPPNPSFEWHGFVYELPIWSWYSKYRLTIFRWIRGMFYPMICFFWIDFIYSVIRGHRILNAARKENENGNGGSKK